MWSIVVSVLALGAIDRPVLPRLLRRTGLPLRQHRFR